MSAGTDTATSAGPTTENCRFCWMCRHMCPVGFVTHRETYTPHAWALTVESVKRGQLQWSDETAGVMYACADCGLCQSHCATDQPLPDAIAVAREAIIAAGHAPGAVLDVRDRLKIHGHPYATSSSRAGGSGPVMSTGGDRVVALFVGDAAHHLAPNVIDAATLVLGAAGIGTVPIGVGRSSGWLASSLGLKDVARGLATRALEEIAASGCAEVVVLSTADRWAFEHVYPARLSAAWPAGVIVHDLAGLLADAVADGRLRFRQQPGPPYAYHDPCHSARLGRDGAAPRRLLESALGTEGARPLFWREGRAHPCGAIGGLEFTHPPIAAALADARLADARAAGALRVLSDDPSCVDHLRKSSAPGIVVEHLFEVLAPLCVR
jgi:Fe-S oxidoreductase